MVKVLLRGLRGTNRAYMHDSYTEKLCAAVEFRFDRSEDEKLWRTSSLLGRFDFNNVLIHGLNRKRCSYLRPKLVVKGQDIHLEHVAAAAATNNPALFRALLSRVSTFTDGGRGLYRHPLQTAARFGYYKIIDELLQFEQGNPPVPGRALYVNDRAVNAAMYIAIYSHQVDAIASLSKFYELPGIKMLSESYNTWILEAMQRNYGTVLDCILNMKTGPRLRLSKEAFAKICQGGDVQLLERVMKKRIVKFHRPYPQKDNGNGRRICPLVVAVQSGKPHMVSAVLAEADVEGACKDKANTMWSMSPLNYAITACDSEIVKLLVEKGANIRCNCDYGFCSLRVALAIEDKAIYNILRTALLKQADVFPSYEEAYEEALTNEEDFAVCFRL